MDDKKCEKSGKVTQMNEWFEKEWAGIAQIFVIRRYVKQGEQEREEMVYGFTNLPRKKAKAKRLLELNQKHWRIENRLHYRRDVTLGEDACQVRVKGAPQALAALNGGILAFMDWLGVSNVASQMRHFCASPKKRYNCCLAGFRGRTGKPKSPDFLCGFLDIRTFTLNATDDVR